MATEVNLAPKGSYDDDDHDELNLATSNCNDGILPSHSGSSREGASPVNFNFNVTTTTTVGASTSRSMDEISPTANRARTSSNSSSHNPGGSADTRRRITKLSKARAREKVPRLVEYFCVVSSVPVDSAIGVDNGNGDAVNRNAAVGSGGILGGSPPKSKSVTNVMPIPNTPGNPPKLDTNDTDRDDANDIGGQNNNATTVKTTIDGSEFTPQITARYPPVDHEENPLLAESITAFCFPSGKIPVVQLASSGVDGGSSFGGGDGGNACMPKVHYFVTTGERGQSMYGTCLTVWEGHEVTVQVKQDADNGAGGGKNVPKKSKAERAMAAPVYNKHDFLTPTKKKHDGSNTSNEENVTITTQIVYLPKCLVILSMHPYLVAFREYLTQLHRLSKMSPPITTTTSTDTTTSTISNKRYAMTLPLERYITNFCSELPAPPPGSFQVQTTILDSVISIWSPPHNMPIAWVSLPFSHLFQCLDVENVLTVWTALALERQVLVTSTQLSLLTTCCEILLSLLFPMKWSHAYIPVLPHFLVPILSAPMPFLCGIDKRHLAYTLEDLSSECIVVDLDKNQVSLGVKTPPLPSLPKYIYKSLMKNVEENAGGVYREVRSLRKKDNTSEMGFYLPPEVKSMADAMWESRLCLFDEAFMLTFTPEERRKNWLNGDDGSGGGNNSDPTEALRLMTLNDKQSSRSQSQWDAVQEAFLDTYCFLLQRYRKYLVFPSKQNEGAYGGAGFRSQEFLAGQRGDVREFLEELVGSQMFVSYYALGCMNCGITGVLCSLTNLLLFDGLFVRMTL